MRFGGGSHETQFPPFLWFFWKSMLSGHVLLRGSLNFCSCITWFLYFDHLVEINRSWLYKETKSLCFKSKRPVIPERIMLDFEWEGHERPGLYPHQRQHFYRPQRSWGVCHSVNEGGVCSRGCLATWGLRPGGVPGGDPPSPDGHCCGRYASYWNAFLSILALLPILCVCEKLELSTDNTQVR